ncbi:MAG: ATP-binding protein [Firmicutes bacterium]|nr:ATP-binding protein [Bacillota bacterium]
MVKIDYSLFCSLVAAGPSKSVIFKIECNALQNITADNGELARDIIALANNHGNKGYIVIGVSVNREFKSVTNPNLTEERLRGFCRAAIFPEPIVSLLRLDLGYEGVQPEHQGKTFVMIRVGPHFVGVFRFHQDFVDFGASVCFQKNQVWVRRQIGSAPPVLALASPEEIKQLFDSNNIPEGLMDVENKVSHLTKRDTHSSNMEITKIPQNYARTPWERAFPMILKEMAHLARKAGGRLFSSEDPFNTETGLVHHLVLPVNQNPLIFRALVTDKCTDRNQVHDLAGRFLTFEHGLFLISLGPIEAEALAPGYFKSQKSWGWFFTGPFGQSGFQDKKFQVFLPTPIMKQLGPVEICGIALANIQTDQILQQFWSEMQVALNQDGALKQALDLSYSKILTALSFYLREGCPRPASKNILPKKLLANEIYDPEQYGEILMVKQPAVYDAIIKMLKKLRL